MGRGGGIRNYFDRVKATGGDGLKGLVARDPGEEEAGNEVEHEKQPSMPDDRGKNGTESEIQGDPSLAHDETTKESEDEMMEEITESPVKVVTQPTEMKRWGDDGWSDDEDDEMELNELQKALGTSSETADSKNENEVSTAAQREEYQYHTGDESDTSSDIRWYDDVRRGWDEKKKLRAEQSKENTVIVEDDEEEVEELSDGIQEVNMEVTEEDEAVGTGKNPVIHPEKNQEEKTQ